MNTYLAIITTVLVVTQIIRLIQNTIQLRRQEVLFKEQLGQLADTEVTKEDFDIQRKAHRLIVEFLERKCKNDTKCTDFEVGGAEMNEDRCVCCGEIIPEGRMVCPNCTVTVKHPCQGCIYFKACGESTRTAPCKGRKTKREARKNK